MKLRDAFIASYKKGTVGLTAEKLKEANIGWADIFEEIPIVVHNSPLVTALMAQVRPAGGAGGAGAHPVHTRRGVPPSRCTGPADAAAAHAYPGVRECLSIKARDKCCCCCC